MEIQAGERGVVFMCQQIKFEINTASFSFHLLTGRLGLSLGL